MRTQQRVFGSIIRRKRLSLNLGLRELARQLEISPSYLSEIENDTKTPGTLVLRQLAVALQTSVAALSGGVSAPNDSSDADRLVAALGQLSAGVGGKAAPHKVDEAFLRAIADTQQRHNIGI